MSRFLAAIESSCDETAVTLFDLRSYLDGADLQSCIRSELLATSARLHEAYGGVVPELAAREQALALAPLFKKALDDGGITAGDLAAVAATAGPGLNGSLLVGFSFAKGLAFGRGIPLYPVNHLEGHLASHELLPKTERLTPPYLALLVSGGHTEVIAIESNNKKRTLARTRDDAAGEAFDKSATLLGFPYPGGPLLSRAAKGGKRDRFELPIGVADDPKSFSFSGLKTAVLRTVQSLPSPMSEQDRIDLSASVESAIVRALCLKVMTFSNSFSGVFITGGVAANDFLRSELQAACSAKRIGFAAAPPKYCTDNATMIGAAALLTIARDRGGFDNWKPGAGLGPAVPGFEFSTRTAWPVE